MEVERIGCKVLRLVISLSRKLMVQLQHHRESSENLVDAIAAHVASWYWIGLASLLAFELPKAMIIV
jgi:hypothetical protein